MFDSVFNSSSTNTHTLTCVCLFLCIYGVPLMTDSFVGTRYCTSLTVRVRRVWSSQFHSRNLIRVIKTTGWIMTCWAGGRPVLRMRPKHFHHFSYKWHHEAGAQCAEPTIVAQLHSVSWAESLRTNKTVNVSRKTVNVVRKKLRPWASKRHVWWLNYINLF